MDTVTMCLNKQDKVIFHMWYVFLHAVIFTYIESGSIVSHLNGMGCLLKAIMVCLFYNLTHNTIDCSGHSHYQQRGPKSRTSDGLHTFWTCGKLFPMTYCKLQAKNTFLSIDSYLSTGMERRGLSGRVIDSSVFTSGSAVEIRRQ